MSWCYRYSSPLLSGEDMEDGIRRLSRQPKRILVHKGLVAPVVYEVADLPSHDVAMFIAETPGLLPCDVHLSWVDEAIARHVQNDLPDLELQIMDYESQQGKKPGGAPPMAQA
jgi:hypothetical protein